MKKKYLTTCLFFIFLLGMSQAQYSNAQTAGNLDSTNNQTSSSSQVPPLSGTLKISKILINYQIRGGLILNSTLDNDIKSIILEVEGYNTTSSPDAFGPHYLELWISHKLLDVPSRGNFTVTDNGQIIPVEQAQQNIEPRWIIIKYQPGINVIAIQGTRTVYDQSSVNTPQLSTNASSTTQNNIQITNNNSFSLELISTIVFAIVIVIAAISLFRYFTKKRVKV